MSTNVLAFLVLFAALQNIDNLLLACAYHWRGVDIGWRSNLLMAGLSALFTEIAVLAAQITKSELVGLTLGRYPEIIGRGILLMIGVWTLAGYFRAKFFPRLEDSAHSAISAVPRNPMDLREAAVVGTALAVDNLGPSFAFGLVSPAFAAIGFTLSALIFITSIAAVLVGLGIAAKSRNRFEGPSPKFLAGCLLLGIALLDPGDAAFSSLLRWIAH